MKRYKLNRFFQILFSFFFVAGILLIYMGFNNKKIVKLSYAEDNSIHYNVYLKENSFFDTPYLGENKTYIASLIDYIDINFNYSIKYNSQLTGDTRYKYVAIVRANKRDSAGYYWEKEYDLSSEKVVDVKYKDSVKINDNVKVKYSTYNDILNEFRREYGLNTSGELVVAMKINNTANFENIDRPITVNSEMSLSIPLLEQALEVSINKNTTNGNDILSFETTDNSTEYLVYKICGVVIVVVSLLAVIEATRNRSNIKSYSGYDLKLQKILKEYDSIIANTNGLEIIEGLKQIEISSFEELIDVYNEVRMPINYYKSKNESLFIIINNDIAWIYTLKKEDFKKRDIDDEK